MSASISALVQSLVEDPWRTETGFSDDIEAAHRILFDTNTDVDTLEMALNSWILREQPCFFGRMASKLGTMSFCILTRADLALSDEAIREKIQGARLAWRRDGYRGNKSGFVILAISEEIAKATPDENMLRLAQRLSQLYLDREILPDALYHDELFLEKPGEARATWKWLAGVNYFSTQGDRRWWQDHRIPGGMALSVNSVGHMIKSAIIGRGMAALDASLGIAAEDWSPTKVDSQEQALLFAVKTIGNASDAVSGRATMLLPSGLDGDGNPATGCPFDMKGFSGKNCREYLGYYHTDITLPAVYFRPDVRRPDDSGPLTLDFTYIYDDSIDNPEYFTMGIGERIRADGPDGGGYEAYHKRMKMEPTVVPLSDYPDLDPAVSEAGGRPNTAD